MGAAVDLTPGTASTIFFHIRPFWPSYLDAFTLVKAWCLPKWSAFFYEGQIFYFQPAASEFSIRDSTWFISFFKRKKKAPTPSISRLVASLLSNKTTLLAEHGNAQADRSAHRGRPQVLRWPGTRCFIKQCLAVRV